MGGATGSTSEMTSPDFNISLVPDALDTRASPFSFRSVLEDIINGRWASQVRTVRQAFAKGGKDAAAAPKKKLPAALFSGTFERRANDSLQTHSGLICVDLDELGPQLEGTRDLIAQDPHTLAAFISPTGSGLKVVFRCDPARPHKDSYLAAEQYVLIHFGLNIDRACKDVARMCFVSHDPEAMVAADAELLPYPEPKVEFVPPKTSPGSNGAHGLSPGDDYDSRADIPSLLSRHNWTKVGRYGWRRPGKSDGISATFDHVPNRFFVFSSSTAFEPNHVYRPWHVYAILEHQGDFGAAGKALYALEYGERIKPVAKPGDRFLSGIPPGFQPPEFDDQPSESNLRPPSSFPLPKDDDPSVLLGDRYLNRGDGAILVGTSGMGKSGMALQMAALWALGRDFHGIRTARPRRILLIQSEDSDGDVAEILHSIYHVLQLTPQDRSLLDDRLKIISERVARGTAFFAILRAAIHAHHPDLVFINPLQAFMDGDVTDARDLGRFLREHLNALNTPPAFAYIIAHHTTKPATGRDRAERLWHEVMYDMAGGAEIINWARAILSLRAAETEGRYNLVLAKRGRRAGVTRLIPQGAGFREEIQTTIPLQWAHGTIPSLPGRSKPLPIIFWEGRAPDAPAPVASRRPAHQLFTFLQFIPPPGAQPMTAKQIHKFAATISSIRPDELVELLKAAADHGSLELILDPSLGATFRRRA